MRTERIVRARVLGEEGLVKALVGLRNAGVPRRNVEVISDLPLPVGLLGGHMKATRIPFFTATGLVLGLLTGLFLSIGTLLLYPLVVGGQGLITPPVIIITYELTMLGIVLATVAGFVYETRVRRDPVRRAGVYASGGETLVLVRVPPDITLRRIQGALEREGAEEVHVQEVAA
jgi:hypothetical protein